MRWHDEVSLWTVESPRSRMVSVLVTGLSPPPIHVQNSNLQGGSHSINVYGEEGKESEIRVTKQ